MGSERPSQNAVLTADAPRSLCIRADADARMGVGHVMRCLALAQAWQDRGGSVVFVTATTIPSLLMRLHAEGIRTSSLAAADVGGETDLAETVSVARAQGCGWIVLDGYHFGPHYMCGIRDAGLRLLVIDDVADRDLGSADAVLNQNAYAEEALYRDLTPPPRLLLGARYTLLRREFLRQRAARNTPRDTPRTLVTLGGADPLNATRTVMRALRSLSDQRLDVLLVVGQANRHLESLQAELPALRERHDATLVVDPPDLPALMATSDIAVTAAGSSCWELCCLGVPQVILVTADNQRLMPAYFSAHGIAEVFGAIDESRTDALAAMIGGLLADGERRRRLAAAARLVVDGGGADRIVDVLCGAA